MHKVNGITVLFAALLLSGQTNLYSQLDPKLTEKWLPVPEIVVPGDNYKAPSDALILFDGSSLSRSGQLKKAGNRNGMSTMGF